MKNTGVVTVSQLNYYIKSILDGDGILQDVFVKGEISNFTDHYKSGHFYLSLKDEKSCIKAMMFSSAAQRVKFRPEDGMNVIVRGRISCYEATGQYQLYIEDMQPDGLGALNLAFEQLKSKLFNEGLFNEENKKILPKYPRKVGVITSPTGAAIQDIKNILSRRYPIAQVVICPVQVQGEEAPQQMIDALRRFNDVNAADVIIIGRGGGSAEDLWAFNDEGLARAIFESKIPIISAVGHETDFTICDFVADLRAPTPSAGAELAVPDYEDILSLIKSYRYSINASVRTKFDSEKYRLETLLKSHTFKFPYGIIDERKASLDFLINRIESCFSRKISDKKKDFAIVAEKLNMLNPTNVLIRGYSIVTNEKGKIVKSVKNLNKEKNINIIMQDGNIVCKIIDARSSKDEKEGSV